MPDLYDAIGNLAAAAHASGDDIDGNIFPDDPAHDRHGLEAVPPLNEVNDQEEFSPDKSERIGEPIGFQWFGRSYSHDEP